MPVQVQTVQSCLKVVHRIHVQSLNNIRLYDFSSLCESSGPDSDCAGQEVDLQAVTQILPRPANLQKRLTDDLPGLFHTLPRSAEGTANAPSREASI